MHSLAHSETVDVYHGVAVHDPYRWMEDGLAPEVRQWMAEQRAAVRSYMDALPDRPAIRARVQQLLAVDQMDAPWEASGRLFCLKRRALQEQPSIVLLEHGREVNLIDPDDDSTHTRTVHILQVSANGKHLAVGDKCGGEDTCKVRFFDVDRRAFFPGALSRGFHRGLAFASDGRHVYHAHERLDAGRPYHRAVFRRDLVTGTEEEMFTAGDGPRLRVRVLPGDEPDWMAYFVREPGQPPQLYLHHTNGGNVPLPLSISEAQEFALFGVGSRCYALVRRAGQERQVVGFDAVGPEPKDWRIILGRVPSDVVDCALRERFLCITTRVDDGLESLVYTVDGDPWDKIEYPTGGTVRLYSHRGAGQAGVYFQFSSFDTPPTIGRYDLEIRTRQTIFSEEIPQLPKCVERLETGFPAPDGAEIPLSIAWEPEHVSAQPGPLALTTYGGFGARVAPAYSAFLTILWQLGFRFAFVGVRGGAEHGAAWHEAGRRRNKPQTIADFIAGAKWLCTAGWTQPRLLASFGACHSGLVVASAMMEQPNLFGAVLCLNPLLDMLRYDKFDLTYRWIPEFGSAEDPDDFPVLVSYSPYHRVRQGIAYPPILFVSGEADNRTDPLHVRKMAARMQHEGKSGGLVLADISPMRGHSPTMPLSVRIEALTDRLAFLCNALSVRLPQSTDRDSTDSIPIQEVSAL